MRDVLLAIIIFGSVPFILRRPWIGVMMWVWVSLMSPHRLTYGFAFDMPFALVIAAAVFLGLLISPDKGKFPVNGITICLVFMTIWMTLSTIFAIYPAEAWVQWEKVAKIQIMNLVCLYILNSEKHLRLLVYVTALSIGFYGVKGGLFTIQGGGGERVWGPEGSFINDNNALALAIVMVMPLLYYLGTQSKKIYMKWGFFAAVGLCAFSALGSHSRGGLLAMGSMGVFLWLKSKQKVSVGIGMAIVAPLAISLMPEKWFERMNTITEYEEDGSAMGRINAWLMALNLIKDRPLVGGGFELYSFETFARWAPNPEAMHSSHSIYFQMLGEHGIPGFLLFILIWMFTWKLAKGVIKDCGKDPELRWIRDLCAMVQVGLVGFAVGGAFQNLAYFDLEYYMATMVILSRSCVDRVLAKRAASTHQPGKSGKAGQLRAPADSRIRTAAP